MKSLIACSSFSAAAVRASLELALFQERKPALDQVEPRTIGRREVDVEARTFGQPVPDRGRLVRGQIVHDQVYVELGRGLFVDRVEEFPKLDGPVPSVQLSNHLAADGVQRRKQRCRAVSSVVVCSSLDLAWAHRQQRLRPLQRLDLRLLVHAQNQRIVRWIHVQTDDVANFLDQQRIGRQLERLNPMRLQPKRPPDAAHRHVAQAHPLGHVTSAPMRSTLRRRLQSQSHDLLHLLVVHASRCTRSRLIQQSIQPICEKPTPPLANC